MKVINATNVNDALPQGLYLLSLFGDTEPSRNGPVLVSPYPVTTVYARPAQRVLFSAQRDANPFFHLFESLWMLAGRNDVAFPHYYAPMMLYSDDAATLNGAYGYRWRHHFGYDQLAVIIAELKANPASRRCVLAMWDAEDNKEVIDINGGVREYDNGYIGDLKFAIAGSKDVPCNTHVYFRIHERSLDMTVCNRSNDVVWGAYGANAVHFSMLQEYIAASVGVGVGVYYQVANNYHVYTERPDVQRLLADIQVADNRYKNQACPVHVHPLLSEGEDVRWWMDDLDRLMTIPPGDVPVDGFKFETEYFRNVVEPMWTAHCFYKKGDLSAAYSCLAASAVDWHVAGREWIARRQAARAAKGQV